MARTMKTATEATANWQSGFGGAGQKWQDGINAVTVPPGQAAVAAQSRYLSGVQANVGKWASNTGAVTLSQWKAASIAKGPSRLATGATAGAPKYQAKIATVLSTAATIIAALPPRGTVEQNIARSSQFQLAMHQAFRQGG